MACATLLGDRIANPFQSQDSSRTNRRSAVMKKYFSVAVLAAFFAVMVVAADDVVTAVHGVVTKVDAAAKTIVVKTKDGTEHTIHFVEKTTVRGGGRRNRRKGHLPWSEGRFGSRRPLYRQGIGKNRCGSRQSRQGWL